MNAPITIRLPETDLKTFRRLYPKLLGRFLTICVKRAISDKDFFTKIFFSEV